MLIVGPDLIGVVDASRREGCNERENWCGGAWSVAVYVVARGRWIDREACHCRLAVLPKVNLQTWHDILPDTDLRGFEANESDMLAVGYRDAAVSSRNGNTAQLIRHHQEGSHDQSPIQLTKRFSDPFGNIEVIDLSIGLRPRLSKSGNMNTSFTSATHSFPYNQQKNSGRNVWSFPIK
jgi:hypothetical protein